MSLCTRADIFFWPSSPVRGAGLWHGPFFAVESAQSPAPGGTGLYYSKIALKVL